MKAYYNSDYAYLEDPDSVFSALTLEEAIYLFRQEGNYLLLLGGSWCGNTTPVIGYIDQVAKEYGIDTIYNLDFRLDGTNRASHIRETNGASSEGTVLPGSLYNYLYGELVTNYLSPRFRSPSSSCTTGTTPMPTAIPLPSWRALNL